MTADLLARIAKSMEEDARLDNRDDADWRLAVTSRSLLRECAAALKIAVEALQRVANCGMYGYAEAGCLWCLDTEERDRKAAGIVDGKHFDDCPVGQALSRLASTPVIHIAPHSVNPSDPRYGGHPTMTFPPENPDAAMHRTNEWIAKRYEIKGNNEGDVCGYCGGKIVDGRCVNSGQPPGEGK